MVSCKGVPKTGSFPTPSFSSFSNPRASGACMAPEAVKPSENLTERNEPVAQLRVQEPAWPSPHWHAGDGRQVGPTCAPRRKTAAAQASPPPGFDGSQARGAKRQRPSGQAHHCPVAACGNRQPRLERAKPPARHA